MLDAYSDWIIMKEGGSIRAYVKSWIEEEDSTTATVYIWGCAECYDISNVELEMRLLVDGCEVKSNTASIDSVSSNVQFSEMEGRMVVIKKEEAQTIAASCTIKMPGDESEEDGGKTKDGESEEGDDKTASDESREDDKSEEDTGDASTDPREVEARILIDVDPAVSSSPEAPTDLVAVRDAAATIKLSWTNNSKSASSTIIERMKRGGVWTEILVTRQVLTEFTDSPGIEEYKYRVRYLNAYGYSEYSNETEYINALCAPAPPTLVSPASGAIVDARLKTVTLSWIHNAIDASSQTSAQAAWSLDGEVYQTLTAGKDQTCALPISGNSIVYWKVRTKGLHADYGAWSAVSSFLVRTAPVVTVKAPEVITGIPFTVSWTYADELGTQVSATIEILNDVGERVCMIPITNQRQEWTIYGTEFTPLNGKVYTLRLTAVSSTSLSSTATTTMKVNYDTPAKPALALTVNKDECSVRVTVFAGQQAAAFLETKSLSVFRDDVLIASNLTSGQSVKDYLPPLDRQIVYKVIAYAPSGSANEKRETIVVRSKGSVVFNFGEGYSELAKVSLNLNETDETQGEKEIYQIASSKYPKVFYGERSTRSGTISGDALWSKDVIGNGRKAMLCAIEALKEHNGLVYMRLPYRDAFTVDCSVQVKRSSSQYNIASVSIDWQVVDE